MSMSGFQELLGSKIPKSRMRYAPRSFDLVGDICIVEIKDDVRKYEKKIAGAIMQLHKNVKVIAKKASAMHGEFRVRKLRVISGEKRTETVYKESGCLMKLDVARAYFSVRLSHERERIAALVKDGENVLVMFAGVGPFALVIAKKNPRANVTGIELNPVAARYFEENIRLNKTHNCISIKGDVRKVIPARFNSHFDRVLMPLPKSAEDFLGVAFKAAKNNAAVHFYNFGAEETVFEDVRKKIDNAAKKARVRIKILNERIVRPYAPHIVQMCIDFQVVKK